MPRVRLSTATLTFLGLTAAVCAAIGAGAGIEAALGGTALPGSTLAGSAFPSTLGGTILPAALARAVDRTLAVRSVEIWMGSGTGPASGPARYVAPDELFSAPSGLGLREVVAGDNERPAGSGAHGNGEGIAGYLHTSATVHGVDGLSPATTAAFAPIFDVTRGEGFRRILGGYSFGFPPGIELGGVTLVSGTVTLTSPGRHAYVAEVRIDERTASGQSAFVYRYADER